MSASPGLDEALQEKINQLREMWFQSIESEKSKYDERDLKLIETNDVPLISFIETNPNLPKALEAMKKHCLWRAKENINDLSDQSFPREIHQLGWIFTSGLDKQGRPLMWIRLKVPVGPKSLQVKYFTWSMEKVRNHTLTTGIKPGVVYDCRDPSIDLQALREFVDIAMNQYPPWLDYVAFCDMGKAFGLIFKVVRYFFPKTLRDSIKFLTMADLSEVISQENFPDYLDGNVKTITSKSLEACPKFAEFGPKNNFTEKDLDKYQQFFDTNTRNYVYEANS